METAIKLRLMETRYGDRFLAVNGYKAADGWHIGAWETLATRRYLGGMMDGYETVGEWEFAPGEWEMLLDAMRRRVLGDAGSARSEAKAAASRENGKKGGRPRKVKPSPNA